MPILHSKILGEGTPLLILHGFLGMLDNWKTIGKLYAENGFNVHLIDQRNHGKSFHSSDFDYDFLAGDIKEYMAGHHMPHAVAMGHSMGGKTVMQLACNHPELVTKLIVADIAPKYYPPHHQTIINALNDLTLEKYTSRTEVDEALAKNLTDVGIRQFLLKNLYWETKNKLGFRFNLQVLSQKMEEIGENIGATDVFPGPTLFLRGDRSEYIVPEDYPNIRRHFPLAKIETIDKAGHWLHAENPSQFFEKSLTFMK
ncbi:alpha/beta fold hydrolase [Flavobacteriaceae bacterium F89]|uniref:Alpha/beta fold hydrolase n=1 Tax=Cerina litoralis TaxID=2874477 RepID=A0AAE3ETD2_9FLAO|nr:alpha/beta fold hydrolase [Cerina litoralis]MCG2460598.1 alpha/beta fold hydrolase [Cerina litoralis]